MQAHALKFMKDRKEGSTYIHYVNILPEKKFDIPH